MEGIVCRGETGHYTTSSADTDRRIRSGESDRGETDENVGGYIGVYATLKVKTRRKRSASSWGWRLIRIAVEEKGWKAGLKVFIRHYQRNLMLNHAGYNTPLVQKKHCPQCYGLLVETSSNATKTITASWIVRMGPSSIGLQSVEAFNHGSILPEFLGHDFVKDVEGTSMHG